MHLYQRTLLAFALVGGALVAQGDKRNDKSTAATLNRNPYIAALEDSLGTGMETDTLAGVHYIADVRMFTLQNKDHKDKYFAQMSLMDMNRNSVLDNDDKPIGMVLRDTKSQIGKAYSFDICNFPEFPMGDTTQAVIVEKHDELNQTYTYALTKNQVGNLTDYIAREAGAARHAFILR